MDKSHSTMIIQVKVAYALQCYTRIFSDKTALTRFQRAHDDRRWRIWL